MSAVHAQLLDIPNCELLVNEIVAAARKDGLSPPIAVCFAQACRSHADAIIRVIVLAGTCSPFRTHFRVDRGCIYVVQVLFIRCGVGGITPSLSTRVAVWLTACFLPADYVFVVTIKPAASAASAHTERFKADLMVCLHEYPPPALALALALLPFCPSCALRAL